jgi:hypothetical protein
VTRTRDEIGKGGYDPLRYASAVARLFFCGLRDNPAGFRECDHEHCKGVGDIMIGPPGLPKYGRRVFAFAAPKRSRQHQHSWKWVTGLYLAGVLAHFSHHMVGLPDGSNPSSEALMSAPLSLVWPADLMKTLITLG